MPEIPRVSAFNIVANLQDQLNFNLSAGQGDPLAGTGSTIPVSINTQEVTQNSNGTWSQVIIDKESPVKDQNKIVQTFQNQRESTIKNYEEIAAVYDRDVLKYNEQINQKKAQITSIQTTALGIGCSCLFGNADNINGVACGIGSTIRQDDAKINVYTDITNYSSINPFKSEIQNLSFSNLGQGFQNVISNNTGTILTSNYGTVTGFAFTMVGLVTTLVPSAVCAGYATSINTLASEIAELRKNRDRYLTEINDLKDVKNDEEFRRWGNRQADSGIQDYNNSIRNAITMISQYLDNIVMENLIVHYDASEDYGIEFSPEPATAINAVTKWNNLSGDGLYATPQTSVYSINRDTDGPSVELNNYLTPTNQYFSVSSSFIDSQKIGNGDTSYAIESWFKVTKDSNLGISSTTNGASIVGVSSIHGYGLQVYKPSGIRLNFGERGNGRLNNNTDLNTNTWYHVIATNEAGVGSKIYLNGVLDGIGTPINITSSVNDLQIGYNTVQINQYFSGKISLIRIYNKNLTQDDVTKNFNAQKERYGY